MAEPLSSTDTLILELRNLAKTAEHDKARDLREAADRLQDHCEVFRRLAQALPGAHKAEDYREVGNSALQLITTRSDLSIGTLITLLLNQLRGMKSRREFSSAITKLQECGFWYQQGLREIDLDQQASTVATLDPAKAWIHYVPIKAFWSGEEVNKAMCTYREGLEKKLDGVHDCDNDMFLPEIDGKSARIVVVG